jgi:hypothetical protein
MGEYSDDIHKMLNYHSFAIGTLAFIGILLVIYYFISRYPRLKRLITISGIYLILMHNFFSVNFTLSNDMLDQSPNMKDKIFALSRTPIDFLWWRAFYKIDYQTVSDLYKTLDYLKNNYSHDPICVKGNIYNNFLDATLTNIQRRYDGTFADSGLDEPIANKNCILVFSNDSDFIGRDEMNQLQGFMMQNKCVTYGKFHVCNNLN